MHNLFKPGKIGKLQIKNRIVLAPMGTGGLQELDGRYSPRAIDYFVERAKGGTGLIITGATLVDMEIEKRAVGPWSTMPMANSPIYTYRLSELADAVHLYGSKIAAQLSAGYGRNIRAACVKAGWAVGPSAVPSVWVPEQKVRELTVDEIERLVESFGVAGGILKNAGFDAIELHAHEGYLIDQFMTPLWNKRQDRYGGDVEGWLRFPVEIIESIRGVVGEDFPVIFRFSASHHLEGGREIEESCEIAKYLQKTGVDAFHVDSGCYEKWHWAHPSTYQEPGCLVDEVAAIKKVVDVPVITVGKLGSPALAEKVLAEEKADFIALGRALLADPKWPKKIRENRIDDIRPCISCHDGCLGRIYFETKYLSCAVNPAAGMEKEFALHPAEREKRVLVVGGGPAGMEASRVAAIQGHKVTLWEKSDKLGGHLISKGVPDFMQEIRSLKNYLSGQLKKLGVEVELKKEGTPELLKSVEADEIIIATGAKPSIPDIPGVNKEKVVHASELLLSQKDPGEKIVVVGGGPAGCETAAWLARGGKNVTIVEISGTLLSRMFWANKIALLEILSLFQVEIFLETRVLEVTDEGILIEAREGQRELEADTIVLAVGRSPRKEAVENLKASLPNLHAVGDCVRPGKILNAIWDAYHTARLL